MILGMDCLAIISELDFSEPSLRLNAIEHHFWRGQVLYKPRHS